MDCQREDGRIPGQISCEDGKLDPIFTHYQGNCFPRHALNMYYLAEQKKDYLEYLYSTLEKFDKHLWDTRDSDGDGCLEVWCMWDLGEDGSERLKGFHGGWIRSILRRTLRHRSSRWILWDTPTKTDARLPKFRIFSEMERAISGAARRRR